MSGVQSFINGRQPGQQGSPRQASASLFKVPVPSTKLAQSELRSTNSRSAHNFLNGRPSAGQNSPLRGSKAAQTLTGHRDGFDTDAESLEDTTIMSIGDDSRNRNQLRSNVTQPQSNGFDSRFRLAYGNGREQRPNAQRLDQLEAEDPAIEGEGEAESYEGAETKRATKTLRMARVARKVKKAKKVKRVKNSYSVTPGSCNKSTIQKFAGIVKVRPGLGMQDIKKCWLLLLPRYAIWYWEIRRTSKCR